MSEDRNGLPPGWAMATVAEVGDTSEQAVLTGPFGTSLGPRDFQPNGVPLLTIGCLTGGQLNLEKARYISEEKAEALYRYRLREGDLLFSRMASVGKSCIVPGEHADSIFNYHLMRLRLSGQVFLSPLFVHYAHGAPQVRSYLREVNHGATRDGVNTTQLLAMPVVVPPLNEQKRIVARVEALQAYSDAAKEALDAIPPLLEKFRQSVLAAAFRGDLTKAWREQHPDVEPASKLLERIRAERRRRFARAYPKKKYTEPEPVDPTGLPELPEGWCWATVEELCWDGPTNGHSGKSSDTATGTLTMKLSATTHGKLVVNPSTTKRLIDTVEVGSKHWLESGDLLVQRANALKYLGSAAVFEPADEPMIYPDLMMRLRATEPFTTTLLWRYFNGLGCRAWFRLKATGTAGNMPKINGAVLKSTVVPLPPEQEATLLLALVEQSFEVINDVEAQTTALDRQHSKFNQSILAKAFRGELVPQDPNDEPASVLLERIRAEREANGASRGRTGQRGRGRRAENRAHAD